MAAREGSAQWSFGLATMLRYIQTTDPIGIGIRLGCLTVIVGTVLASPDRWRIWQLAPAVAGLALGWAETDPDRLARLASGRGPLAAITRHSYTHREIATARAVSLCMALEWLGILGAALLLAGPAPVAMPPPERVLALAALTVYVWVDAARILTDPGYYNTEFPPSRPIMALRYALPALIAAGLLAGVLWPSSPAPLNRGIAAVLAGSVLLLWPYLGLVDIFVRCGQTVLVQRLEVVRALEGAMHQEVVHAAKNQLRARRIIDTYHPMTTETEGQDAHARQLATAYTRGLMDAYTRALVTIEDARRQIGDDLPADDPAKRTVAALWEVYVATYANTEDRRRLVLHDHTGGVSLAAETATILQHAMIDLVSNARDASSSGVITLSVHVRPLPGPQHHVEVIVDDEGPGYATTVFRPDSSMATLHWICQHYGGGRLHTQLRPHGGTRAIATFTGPAPLARLAAPRRG